MPSATLDHAATEYRRLARRVRCRMGNDTMGKQQALAALARYADHRRQIEPAASSPDSEVRAFAAAVSKALEGPVLRYSRRQELIRQAGKLGIRRFDANLLIAAVQNRLGNASPAITIERPAQRSRLPLAMMIGLIVAMQTMIVAGAWAALHS